MSQVRVRTGARIHLGLVDPVSGAGRRFGGAGFILEDPVLEVCARPSNELHAEGRLAARALDFARRARTPPAHLEVRSSRLDHVGLGTGTQLGLAVGAALAGLTGEQPSAVELARRVGRGRRSAIGVHGFERGGFLVDGGTRGAELAPLVARHEVPESWSFLLVVPRDDRGLSGSREEACFDQLDPPPAGLSGRLARTLLLGLLPALADRDLEAFGEALTDYGRLAGEFFREAQGGIFASERIASLVDYVLGEGAAGAGQSSWGPATFALVESEERACALGREVASRFDLEEEEVIVTRVRNEGARVEIEEST